MPEIIIGRIAEQELLKQKLNSTGPELLAIFGRRRVGKTYLIRQVYAAQLVFELTGLHNASNTSQLQYFANQLLGHTKKRKDKAVPADWMDAFEALQSYLEALPVNKRKVIFFDELPWLAGRKSNFLTAFTQFWNSWASRRKDIVVVICGSAASWMVQKIVNNRGGLHNRITARIRLEPFTLNETEQYLKYKKIKLNRYQVLQLYMAMGGIPHYLNEVQSGYSSTQNIEKICFKKDGLLVNEYNNLFSSLFDKAERHEAVMRALAQKPKGLNREQIMKIAKLSAGGGASKVLTELEESGFITFQSPYSRQFKNGIYRITDEYSLFYIKFIESNKYNSAVWSKISRLPSFTAWSGFAFESICLKPAHTEAIKKALGISGIYTETTNWRIPGSTGTQGAQIDLVIDRQDQCINLCELKFSKDIFTINKPYAASLRNKVIAFEKQTKTRKTLFLTFITSYGIAKNLYANSMINNSVTMDDLFDS